MTHIIKTCMLSMIAIIITSEAAIIAIVLKVNWKLPGKNIFIKPGTGAEPKPLSITNFKANGFNKAIGVL